MSEMTTVQLDKSIVKALNKIKTHPRQTYNELIAQMIKIFESRKSKSEYDRFLYEIQKDKMKELWDNRWDEAWENA